MGYGEVGSNGSVHWHVNHNEGGAATHSHVDKSKQHPGKGGSSGAPVIGEGKPKGNHRGKFRITARYLNPSQAEAALQYALASLYPNPGDAMDIVKKALENIGATQRIAVVDVDLRPFNTVSQGPGNPDDWEVRLDW